MKEGNELKYGHWISGNERCHVVDAFRGPIGMGVGLERQRPAGLWRPVLQSRPAARPRRRRQSDVRLVEHRLVASPVPINRVSFST